MKQKLLACDIDGTLVHNHKQFISKEDLDAIKKFREAGNLFTLCTGRTLVWTLPLIEQFEVQTDGLILCNGSMIYKTNPNSLLNIVEIENSSISNKIGLEILEYFYHLKNYTIYWDDGTMTYEIADRLLSKISTIIQENHSIHINITEALTQTTNFVTIGATPMSCILEEAEQTKKTILEKWGDHVTAFRNQYFIDIAPKDASKGNGIIKFQSHLPHDIEIYSVGDSFNDLPMFETVGKSNAFLMANGESSLTKYASHTVKSVAECIDVILSL
ncbi:MAG: HAD-IIB family hydrolase [Spirochaetota bacterium]|nr:HAD-IIB family hydrolase [Spirochaetota bacterium]